MSSVELCLGADALATFSLLLQQGVLLPLAAPIRLSLFLYHHLELAPDFVEHYLTTVFLNGRPVDDLDRATLRPGDTLALSAAMPGLVGATLRRRGLIASFRSTISHRPEAPQGPVTGSSTLKLKLFNLMLETVGPGLLARGILLPPGDWEAFLQLKGPTLWANCRQVSLDGQEIQVAREATVSWGQGGLMQVKIICLAPSSEAAGQASKSFCHERGAPMTLQVFLSANLRQYVPDYNAATGVPLTIKPGATPRDVARLLHLAQDEVKLIMVNGLGAAWDTILAGDERVAFFPPVGGG
jgi:molybdopterin converting factor small subunit